MTADTPHYCPLHGGPHHGRWARPARWGPPLYLHVHSAIAGTCDVYVRYDTPALADIAPLPPHAYHFLRRAAGACEAPEDARVPVAALAQVRP